MADIMLPQQGGRRKIHNTRIDFTPMVDLGFILITFFIYTTTIARSSALQVTMPDNTPSTEATVYAAESTITLLPISGHRVVCYYGALQGADQLFARSIDDVRGLLLQKSKQVAALPASFSSQAHMLHVIIRPTDACKYEDVVRLLDEMLIARITYYTLADVQPAERSLMAGQHLP